MSSQTIEMHFKEIMNLAFRLRELSGKLDDLAAEKMMQIVYGIKAVWNSECADLLTGREVKLAALLMEEAKQLDGLAADMESRAEKMYQQEMANIRLAVTRIY